MNTMQIPIAIHQIDFPECYDAIYSDKKVIVTKWIKENLIPRKTANTKHTSYGLKHLFEHSDVGFYMTNGMFKGAMLACRFKPVRANDLNCIYCISEKSPAFNAYKCR